jgi:4-amino-4-deoxy-L-arabinose transferase-like glycosyltransferase
MDSQLRSFALAAIEHEPAAYGSTILGDLAHYASFGHWTTRFDTPFTHWRFPTTLDGPHLAATERSIARHGGTLALDGSLVGPLRDYQRVIFLPGTAMAVILLAGLAAAAIGRRPPARRLRGEAMLFGFVALLLPMTAAATTMFDYRYALPAIPPVCVAAGIAGLVAFDRLRTRAAAHIPVEVSAPAAPLDPGAEQTTVGTIA